MLQSNPRLSYITKHLDTRSELELQPVVEYKAVLDNHCYGAVCGWTICGKLFTFIEYQHTFAEEVEFYYLLLYKA